MALQSWRTLFAPAITAAAARRSISLMGNKTCVSKAIGPLRPHAPTRDALSESGASLGRAYRRGPPPGKKLAADGIWLAGPVGGLGARFHLAIIARHRHTLGRAGRPPR